MHLKAFIFQHHIEFSQKEILPDYSISRSVEGQHFWQSFSLFNLASC